MMSHTERETSGNFDNSCQHSINSSGRIHYFPAYGSDRRRNVLCAPCGRCQHCKLIIGLAVIGALSFALVLISVILALLNVTGSAIKLPVSGKYSPNQTQTIDYSSSFCDSVSIKPGNTTSPYKGTFSILSQPPKLSGNESIKFSAAPSFRGYEISNWHFFLNEGSIISFSPCTEIFTFSFYYYIIKGRESFEQWTKSPDSNTAVVKEGTIFETCDYSGDYITYNITQNDEYFIVFRLLDGEDATLFIDFDIYRAKFIPVPNTIIDSCSIEKNNCTLKVPLSYSIGLISIESNTADNWPEGIEIAITCDQRAWVYLALAFATALIVFVLIGLVLCCCYCIRKRRHGYHELKGINQDNPVNQSGPTTEVSASILPD